MFTCLIVDIKTHYQTKSHVSFGPTTGSLCPTHLRQVFFFFLKQKKNKAKPCRKRVIPRTPKLPAKEFVLPFFLVLFVRDRVIQFGGSIRLDSIARSDSQILSRLIKVHAATKIIFTTDLPGLER